MMMKITFSQTRSVNKSKIAEILKVNRMKAKVKTISKMKMKFKVVSHKSKVVNQRITTLLKKIKLKHLILA